jgi:flagellar biosynthesis protein FlhA
VTAAESEAFPDRQLGDQSRSGARHLPGIATQDPAFKLPAIWIEPGLREQAQTLGYTVVDASTVIATHLNQILLAHAHELLGHEETQQLLDRLAKTRRAWFRIWCPKPCRCGWWRGCCKTCCWNRCRFGICGPSPKLWRSTAPRVRTLTCLTAAVRVALGRMIVQNINGLEDELPVITLPAELEQILLRTLQMGKDEQAPLEPGLAERCTRRCWKPPRNRRWWVNRRCLLVPDVIRVMLARFVRHGIPNLHVLAFSEVPEDKKLKVIATVGK